MNRRNIVLVWLLILLYLLPVTHVRGQAGRKRTFPYDYGYGFTGGFTYSDFRGDSTGYRGTAMPYGGGFVSMAIIKQLKISASFLYTVKGVDLDSPYRRFRYNFVSTEIITCLRLFDFLLINAGYNHNFESSSRVVMLNGNNPSGIERSDIKGFGSYGQWVVGGTIRFNPSVALIFLYGIPQQGTPLTHVRMGVQLNLRNRVEGKPKQDKQLNQNLAAEQVKALREGILLVRLPSMQHTIHLMEERGMVDKALELKHKTEKENLLLRNAFSKYSFSRVFFFYDYHSNQVRSGEIDAIVFDKHLNPVSADLLNGNIFTAEFGLYESPERSYHIKHDFQYLKENKISPDSSAAWIQYGDKGFGIGGIVIMDQQFKPLDKPFPVFTPITNRTIFPSDTKLERSVVKLNEELFRMFYRR